MSEDNEKIEVVNENTPAPSSERPTPTDPIDKREDFSAEIEEPEGGVDGDAKSPGIPGTMQVEKTPEEKIADLEDQLLRSRADLDNLRKRLSRQMDEQVRAANDKLLGQVIEVIDNFERAFQHANEQTDLASMRKGMEMIYSQLLDLLNRNSVKPIEALGAKFDPGLHEAMMQVETSDYPEGMVAMEIGKGYRAGERVIRHSKVGVSTGKSTK